MRKKIIAAGVILVLAVSLLCFYFLSPFIYFSFDVKVTQVEPKQEKETSQVSWLAFTEEQVYQNHSVILTGTVKNVREARVDYKYEGSDQSQYITLAEIVVSEYFHNSGLKIKSGDTLTVGHGITSYMYSTDVPEFEVGKEYVLFCMVPSEQLKDDPMGLDKYVDCWITAPHQLILPKVDDYCYVNPYWRQSLPGGSSEDYDTIKNVIFDGVTKYWNNKLDEGETLDASTPPTTTAPLATTTAPAPTTTAPAPTTEPVDAEMAYFLELFRWSEGRNPYNHALRVMYDFASPEEINLRSFYDGGLAGENEITDEEWAEYSKLVADPNNVHGDFHRLPKDKIEAELQAVFGISLADLPDSAFRGLFYLECSDSYCYNQSGVDSKSAGSFTDIIHNDDGTVSLIYEDRDGKCAITLKSNGDSYLIVSNIHVE